MSMESHEIVDLNAKPDEICGMPPAEEVVAEKPMVIGEIKKENSVKE